LCDWARLKFDLTLTPEEVRGQSEEDVNNLLRSRLLALYRRKEVEFPVLAAMARFMSDRATPGAGSPAQRYNREGLYFWATDRFAAFRDRLKEDDFRTQSRKALQDLLLEVSSAANPARTPEDMDARIDEELKGTRLSESGDAEELAAWAKTELGLEVSKLELTGVTRDQARNVLWNAYDARYRPEMRAVERSLLLNFLDSAWKNHLYTMDHLRQGIGLYGYAQEDPKTKYKQEGMKEFKAMWEAIEDKVTETIFRIEENTEAFQESLWAITSTRHDAAPRAIQAAQDQTTNAGGEGKKPEPIRNRGEKVGRNDPCPCGSGKKYKNCHMRQTV
jgi:preprotein translocase subunit SecA